MIENVDEKPDIVSLIQQTEVSQRLISLSRKAGNREMSLVEIMVHVAYGSYRLGLEVAGGLRPPVDIGRVKIEDLFPTE